MFHNACNIVDEATDHDGLVTESPRWGFRNNRVADRSDRDHVDQS